MRDLGAVLDREESPPIRRVIKRSSDYIWVMSAFGATQTSDSKDVTSAFDPLAEVVGFKGERHKPSYRSVTPLDARCLPTVN